MKTVPMKPSLCPYCGAELNRTTAVGDQADRPIQPEDWGACIRCAGILQFTSDGRPRLPALGAYEALALANPAEHAEIEGWRVRLRAAAHLLPPLPQEGRA